MFHSAYFRLFQWKGKFINFKLKCQQHSFERNSVYHNSKAVFTVDFYFNPISMDWYGVKLEFYFIYFSDGVSIGCDGSAC